MELLNLQKKSYIVHSFESHKHLNFMIVFVSFIFLFNTVEFCLYSPIAASTTMKQLPYLIFT